MLHEAAIAACRALVRAPHGMPEHAVRRDQQSVDLVTVADRGLVHDDPRHLARARQLDGDHQGLRRARVTEEVIEAIGDSVGQALWAERRLAGRCRRRHSALQREIVRSRRRIDDRGAWQLDAGDHLEALQQSLLSPFEPGEVRLTIAVPRCRRHRGEARRAQAEQVLLATFPPGHAETDDADCGVRHVWREERRHSRIDVREAAQVPLVATAHGRRGEHRARVVVDDVQRIPRRMDDLVARVEHPLRWEVHRVPVHLQEVGVQLVRVVYDAVGSPQNPPSLDATKMKRFYTGQRDTWVFFNA